MRKALIIVITSIVLNFFILSIGYGQSGSVRIGGIVPETELNRNTPRQQIQLNNQTPPTGENKFLYFFEKNLGLQKTEDGDGNSPILPQSHTIYDRISSQALLWLLTVLMAIIVVLILRFLDRYFLPLIKVKKRKKHKYE